MAEHDPLKELTGLAVDVNVNEIADHIASELEKLRRENFGLKTTVANLRAKVEKFYNHR